MTCAVGESGVKPAPHPSPLPRERGQIVRMATKVSSFTPLSPPFERALAVNLHQAKCGTAPLPLHNASRITPTFEGARLGMTGINAQYPNRDTLMSFCH